MAELRDATLCVLGCGNLGTAILKSLLDSAPKKGQTDLPFSRFIACVRSERSEQSLRQRLSQHAESLSIYRGENAKAVQESDVVILGADPADIKALLAESGIASGLSNKLLISIAAGWTRQQLEITLYGAETNDRNQDGRAWVVRTLPNIAAQVSQSLTAIEISEPHMPATQLKLVDAIFEKIGKVVHVPPRLINATTAVGGSTPAFFAVICDALIDAAVAVGMPRDMAQTMIFQSMRGTAAMLQNGIHTAILRDQGTSPEGCTIGGLMVLEEGAVRGHIGRALREAVTIARLMGTVEHVNDTRN